MQGGYMSAVSPNFNDNVYDVFQGEVQLYTIFGIPYGELRIQCTGSDLIRCPAACAECKRGDGARSFTARRWMGELDKQREILGGLV